jgi:hypothetical protein
VYVFSADDLGRLRRWLDGGHCVPDESLYRCLDDYAKALDDQIRETAA